MSRDDCYAGESRLRNSLRISSESDAASPMTLGTFGWITIPPPAVVCQRHEVDLEKRRDWISLRAPLKGFDDHGSKGFTSGAMQPLKAVVKNGRLVVDEPTALPEGTEI